MKVGTTVETREFGDAAFGWIIGNAHRLAPAVTGALVLTALAVFWIGPWLLQGPWLGRAIDAHEQWVETRHVPGGRILDTRGYLAGLRRLGPIPHLPDLSATGLAIRQVSHVAAADGRPGAFHVGYAEPDGCRVSLWITPTAENGVGALEEYRRGEVFAWFAGGLRYVLVGSDTRYERFYLLAKTARETTAARMGPEMHVELGLAMSAMTGPTCED